MMKKKIIDEKNICYLELAKRLRLPLLIFDGQMARVGKEMGIDILGE